MNIQLATRFNYRNVNSTANLNTSGRTALCGVAQSLTEDQLRQYVPSIYAETAHESRSARYAYIPTAEVVRGLMSNGFAPVFACEAKARDEAKVGFTKHMVRFRHADYVPSVQAGAVPELVMINSHDGSTRYQFFAGMFRFLCANGSIVGTGYGECNVRHTGNVVQEAIEGAYTVVEDFKRITSNVEQLAEIKVTEDQQRAYADAALAIRYFDPETEKVEAPIEARQLLIPRRYDDAKNDLWTVANVAQENIIRGGLRGRTVDENGRRRRTSTRAVNGIDGNVKLNRALWTLTEKMAEIMGHKLNNVVSEAA